MALAAVLAFLGSLSEGLGLVMLVPLLQLALGDNGGIGGTSGIAAQLQALGLPLGIGSLLILFALLIALRTILVQWRIIVEAQVQMMVTDNLRATLFGALLRANWRLLSQLRQGDMLSLVLSAPDRAGTGLQFLLGLGSALLTLAAIMLAALLIAPLPTLAMGLGGLLVLVLYTGLRRRAAHEGEALSGAYGDFYSFFTERLDALRMIKSFGKEGQEAAHAEALSHKVRQLRLVYQRGLGIGQFALQAGAAVVLALGVWLSLTRWNSPLSSLLPLIALFARSVPLLGAVQMSWQQWAYNAPALDELAQALAKAREAADPPADNSYAANLSHEIRLDQVSVRFEGRAQPALEAVSLVIAAGSTTFVTGPSGAGKSTLADLVAGLILPDRGAITIDGDVLDASRLSSWRNRVAYVQQEPLLFDMSVRDNLRWAAPAASDAMLETALARASAGFILDLPDGLGTRVGSSGRQLSGGERQRIVLARALLRDPALLILDEATSALDAANEAAITEAITALKGKLTIIIIGHRGALAVLADQIIELADGRVIPHDCAQVTDPVWWI